MKISHSSRKIMKRKTTNNTNKKPKKRVFNSSIKSLPNELLSEVIARVAFSSFTDYINAKLSCKIFYRVSDDRYVYRNMSLEEFSVGPSWKRDEEDKEKKLSLFMRTCRESGNVEALYRKGVVDFFTKERPKVAMECLDKAAEAGHFVVLGRGLRGPIRSGQLINEILTQLFTCLSVSGRAFLSQKITSMAIMGQ